MIKDIKKLIKHMQDYEYEQPVHIFTRNQYNQAKQNGLIHMNDGVEYFAGYKVVITDPIPKNIVLCNDCSEAGFKNVENLWDKIMKGEE